MYVVIAFFSWEFLETRILTHLELSVEGIDMELSVALENEISSARYSIVYLDRTERGSDGSRFVACWSSIHM